MTFRQFANSRLTRKKPKSRTGTLGFYTGAIMKFATFLGTKVDAELAEITSDEVAAFRNHKATTLAAKTVNHDLKCLRMLFRAARRDKVLTDDPSEFVSVTTEGQTVRSRPFTILEIKAVVAVAGDEWRSSFFSVSIPASGSATLPCSLGRRSTSCVWRSVS